MKRVFFAAVLGGRLAVVGSTPGFGPAGGGGHGGGPFCPTLVAAGPSCAKSYASPWNHQHPQMPRVRKPGFPAPPRGTFAAAPSINGPGGRRK